MVIFRNANQKAQVSLQLSESMLCLESDNSEPIPKNHRLDVTPVTRQTLGVFSQVSGKARRFLSSGPLQLFSLFEYEIMRIIFCAGSHKIDENLSEPDKLVLEGKIVQRLECRPHGKQDTAITLFLRSRSVIAWINERNSAL